MFLPFAVSTGRDGTDGWRDPKAPMLTIKSTKGNVISHPSLNCLRDQLQRDKKREDTWDVWSVLSEYMQIYVLNSQCVISLDNVCLSVGEWPSVLALWRGTWCVMASLYITSSRFRFPYTVLSCVHRDRGPRQMSLSLPNMHSNSGVKAKRTAHAHPPSQVWAHCCWTHTQSYFKYIHKPAMCNRRRQQRPEVFLHMSAVLAGRCIMADGQHVPESIVSLSLSSILYYLHYTHLVRAQATIHLDKVRRSVKCYPTKGANRIANRFHLPLLPPPPIHR